jgi:hypothetical protein
VVLIVLQANGVQVAVHTSVQVAAALRGKPPFPVDMTPVIRGDNRRSTGRGDKNSGNPGYQRCLIAMAQHPDEHPHSQGARAKRVGGRPGHPLRILPEYGVFRQEQRRCAAADQERINSPVGRRRRTGHRIEKSRYALHELSFGRLPGAQSECWPVWRARHE